MDTLSATGNLLGFYRKSLLALIFSGGTTGLTTFTLLELQPLIPTNPITFFNQPISSDSNLLLLPLFLVAFLLMLTSFWICASHLVTTVAMTISQLGYRVELNVFTKSILCAPSARKLLLRTITTSALVATSFSPALASETIAPTEDLHWGTTLITTATANDMNAKQADSISTLSKNMPVTADAAPSEIAIRANAPTDSSATTSWKVREGDCLWNIAASHLGSVDANKIEQYWRKIWHANESIIGADPNLILPGQVLTLPTPNQN